MRAISTTVDATVFLLLVGGAVATLVFGTGAVAESPGNPAADDAQLLATTTASVNYSLAPAAERGGEGIEFHRTEGPDFQRQAHGTLAALLADAAVANATIDGERLSYAGVEFEDQVTSAVRSRIGRAGARTSVTAVWEPYPDAPVSGTVQAGADPPADTDVHSATVYPSGGPAVDATAAQKAAAADGYDGVARVVSRAVVRGLFSPNATRVALRSDYPVDALTARRYRRMARLFGARHPGIGEVSVETSNERLVVGLKPRIESDLRERYDSPAAAAHAVEGPTVRVTVRTWSP